jgi:Activator of Hsp90 ATPase homolog 1-like protein
VIAKRVQLACDPLRAFEIFTEQASIWWPPARRHTGDADSAIAMLATGRFWERARDGHEVELGRVLEWRPGEQLVLDFYPGSDADHPTRVVVLFEARDGGTLVTVEHAPLPASEAIWSQRAAKFAQSWDILLPALAAYVTGA